MSPNSSRVYVINAASNPGTVSVIDTITNKVITTTSVDTGPGDVATTARNVYVTNRGSDTVSVIDI